eukprot:7344652-Alexandrium_andersonii.AAC.1
MHYGKSGSCGGTSPTTTTTAPGSGARTATTTARRGTRTRPRAARSSWPRSTLPSTPLRKRRGQMA